MSRVTSTIDSTGAYVLKYVDAVLELFGLAGESVVLACRPSSWTQPVKTVLFRQILFTAVDAWWLSIRFSFALGVLLVVQIETAAQMISGSNEYLQPVLYRGLVRELAPLLANLIVIGRSGTAMSIQTANAKLNRELEVLDSSGVDLMRYWIMPRIISCAFSVFCLTVVITVALPVFGYAISFLLGFASKGPQEFASNLSNMLEPQDALFFLSKTLLLGLVMGAIFIRTGLMVSDSPSAIPIVATRAAVMGLTAYFAVSAILSVVSYGKILNIDIGQFL